MQRRITPHPLSMRGTAERVQSRVLILTRDTATPPILFVYSTETRWCGSREAPLCALCDHLLSANTATLYTCENATGGASLRPLPGVGAGRDENSKSRFELSGRRLPSQTCRAATMIPAVRSGARSAAIADRPMRALSSQRRCRSSIPTVRVPAALRRGHAERVLCAGPPARL